MFLGPGAVDPASRTPPDAPNTTSETPMINNRSVEFFDRQFEQQIYQTEGS